MLILNTFLLISAGKNHQKNKDLFKNVINKAAEINRLDDDSKYQTDSSDVDPDEYAEAVEEDETVRDDTDRAVAVLTKLIDEQKKEEEKKNSLHQLTNEDLDREIKELTVKKMRIEITMMNNEMINQSLLNQEREEKIKLFSKLSGDYERIITTLLGDKNHQPVNSLSNGEVNVGTATKESINCN